MKNNWQVVGVKLTFLSKVLRRTEANNRLIPHRRQDAQTTIAPIGRNRWWGEIQGEISYWWNCRVHVGVELNDRRIRWICRQAKNIAPAFVKSPLQLSIRNESSLICMQSITEVFIFTEGTTESSITSATFDTLASKQSKSFSREQLDDQCCRSHQNWSSDRRGHRVWFQQWRLKGIQVFVDGQRKFDPSIEEDWEQCGRVIRSSNALAQSTWPSLIWLRWKQEKPSPVASAERQRNGLDWGQVEGMK